ncbi:MAG: LysE family transporter [Paracoccaceae bacterium]
MLIPGLPAAEFLAAWAFLAMNVLSPGPNVLNTIALAIGSGRRAALGAALGTGLGICVWCLGMGLGVATLLATVPGARHAMTVLAIGLLGWFSSRYLRRAMAGFRQGPGAEAPQAQKNARARDGMVRAVSILLTNPKALTTWLTLTAIFPIERANMADLGVLCLGSSVVAGSIHAAYALTFSTRAAARAFLRLAPFIHLGVGIFFGGFALTLAVSLWHALQGSGAM